MNAETRREFQRLRAKGWPARSALATARTNVTFEALERSGCVRVRMEPDDYYEDDDTYPDRTPLQVEHDRKTLWARIEREGVWGAVTEARCPLGGPWLYVDSCFGFIGDDWNDSGYDDAAKDAAIKFVMQYMECSA